MQKLTISYLIKIQYLGFRLHGWAKQTGLKTVHERIDKTIEFILGHTDFKTMGSSRTDAMVSANESSFVLSVSLKQSADDFFEKLNLNLPPDIKAFSIQEVESNYNPLQPGKEKTYLYLFSSGSKPHPFCAPLLTSIPEPLNIDTMQKGAKLFEGEHDFINYATKPNANTRSLRTISFCSIEENTFYTASFFPDKSYALKISANGFMRNQVRLIMAQLFKLGKGELSLIDIENSLKVKRDQPFREIAPGSGLILQEVN